MVVAFLSASKSVVLFAFSKNHKPFPAGDSLGIFIEATLLPFSSIPLNSRHPVRSKSPPKSGLDSRSSKRNQVSHY